MKPRTACLQIFFPNTQPCPLGWVKRSNFFISEHVAYQMKGMKPKTIPVLSGHSKIDNTKVSKTDGSLMQDESIAECSLGAFYDTFDLH